MEANGRQPTFTVGVEIGNHLKVNLLCLTRYTHGTGNITDKIFSAKAEDLNKKF